MMPQPSLRRLAALALCLTQAPAQDAKPSADPAEEIAALLREHEADARDAKAKHAAFAPRFTTFADAHKDTEAEVTARLWLLQECWWEREAGTMEKSATAIVDDLLTRHAGSMQLAKIPDLHYVFDKAGRARVFAALLDSPHDIVVAAAHLGLAKLAPPRPGWRAESDEEITEAHPHLAALRGKYAALPYLETTFGEMANAFLEQLAPKDLAVGCDAPEIVGRDQDGKPMRLSDFRGKVVLLDFWGDW